jgi:hypothetical protein
LLRGEGCEEIAGLFLCLIVILATQRSLVGLYPTQPQNSGQETLMLFAQQVDAPVHIVQASFGAGNLLMDARLENKSHNKIQTYRLGWAVVKKDDIKIARGDLTTVPDGVDTTATFDISAQGASVKGDLAKHPAGIVFYVAELQFQDGTQWQADPKKIKKEAAEMVK